MPSSDTQPSSRTCVAVTLFSCHDAEQRAVEFKKYTTRMHHHQRQAQQAAKWQPNDILIANRLDDNGGDRLHVRRCSGKQVGSRASPIGQQ